MKDKTLIKITFPKDEIENLNLIEELGFKKCNNIYIEIFKLGLKEYQKGIK